MRNKLILWLIIIFGAVLRLWGLGGNPPGLYWDEVSLGWNAYSILKTGFDEHGRFLPIDTFYAFGDYKPPLYIYAVVLSIKVFGLNEFAVRLPSALAGTGLILVTYLLVNNLLRPGLAKQGQAFSERTAHLAAFLIAISPWSVTLSRVGFESNLAVLLNAIGFLFFLYAVKKSPKWLPISVLSFVLAAYTFNANRFLSPMFLVMMSLIYLRSAVLNWKWWLGTAIFAGFLVLPMVNHLRSPEGKLRWNEVNIFSDLGVIKESNSRRDIDGNTLVGRIFHHRYLGYARLFMGHYLEHFSLNYLFVQGDRNPRINIPDIGQMYLIELPFFIIGLMSLMRPMGLMATKEKLVIILWFLFAAVPAGLARETPHALRSASTLPVPQIIVALGFVTAVTKVWGGAPARSVRQKSLLFTIYGLLFFSLLHFQFVYWRYYPNEWAGEWLTSYKNLILYLKETDGPYRTIYVTPDLGRPYIYFLFYTKYDPAIYIKEAKEGGRTGDIFGFFNVNYFNKYKFYVPDLATIAADELVVTRADQPPVGFELLKTIGDTNGYPEFNILKRR